MRQLPPKFVFANQRLPPSDWMRMRDVSTCSRRPRKSCFVSSARPVNPSISSRSSGASISSWEGTRSSVGRPSLFKRVMGGPTLHLRWNGATVGPDGVEGGDVFITFDFMCCIASRARAAVRNWVAGSSGGCRYDWVTCTCTCRQHAALVSFISEDEDNLLAQRLGESINLHLTRPGHHITTRIVIHLFPSL